MARGVVMLWCICLPYLAYVKGSPGSALPAAERALTHSFTYSDPVQLEPTTTTWATELAIQPATALQPATGLTASEVEAGTSSSSALATALDRAGIRQHHIEKAKAFLTNTETLGFPMWYVVSAVATLVAICGLSGVYSYVFLGRRDKQTTMAGRKPTDVMCLIVLLAFMIGMCAVMHYAVMNGNPRRLTHGFNFKGELCGVDDATKDRPFLFWCPTVGEAGQELDFSNGAWDMYGFPINFNSPICVDACPGAAPGNALCPQPSKSVISTRGSGPEAITVTTIEQSMRWRPTYQTQHVMGIYGLPDVSENSALMQAMNNQTSINGATQQVLRAGGSLRQAQSILIFAGVVALLASILYICVLSKFAHCLIYSSLGILLFLFAIVGMYFCMTAYFASTGGGTEQERDSNLLFSNLELDQAVQCHYAIGCISFLGFASLLCVLCCFREKITIAAALVDTAADCMLSMYSLMVEALVDMTFRLALVGFLAYGFFWVLSCGDVSSDHGASIGGHRIVGMSRSLSFTTEQKYMIVYYIFGSFWLLELAHAMGQFVISYMVVLWYFEPQRHGSVYRMAPRLPLPRAYGAAIFYHLGSLAIGSFTIALCRLFKLVLGTVAQSAKGNGNRVLACIASCLGCIIECFQNCMEFINKNAYIDVAINSTNFCIAAKNSFRFIMDNGSEIVVLNGSCVIFQVLGVLSVMATTGEVSYLMATHMPRYYEDDSPTYVGAPMLVSLVSAGIGGLISMVFMLVFDQTADTLLYIFTWDKVHHGPSGPNQCAPASLLELESKGAGYAQLSTHYNQGSDQRRMDEGRMSSDPYH